MSESYILHQLKKFRNQIEGDLLKDYSSRILYATDASAYRELPLAVIKPRNKEDIRKLVLFAGKHGVSLIPRGAGTSLAGQVVGNGIVVDVTRYLNKIIEINPKERWVRVEPGVVLDELNIALARHDLFFGPETSSSNRCVIGGMVGNNSCGAHSLIYGSTRDHTLEIEAILSDGSMVKFKALSKEEFQQKQIGETLENKLYRNITDILSLPLNKEEIRKEYPDPMVKRRNTGYAIDLLLESEPFSESDVRFNFCKLLAGSEGTLAFITEIKLNLVPLPPKVKGLICVHFNSLEEAFQANLIALKYMPGAVELMDNVILQQTKNNLEQARNRFFVKGDPAAILIIEWARETKEEIDDVAEKMELDMRGAGFGYHFPRIFGSDISRVWALRKAGLGVLSNIAGDAKPVSLVEDTAVNPKVLPNYLAEFQQLLDRYGLKAVYHAHIATGELHLRPVLNLKDPKDVELFHTIAFETSILLRRVKNL
jgi:FAD/FMN-containing dehydrogenase